MRARDRRAIARGIVVVLLGLGLLRGVPWLTTSIRATRERVAASQDLLRRRMTLWSGRDSVESVIESGRARLDELEKLVMPVTTDGDGVEWMSDRAREVVAAGGARFARLEHLVESTRGPVHVVGLALEVTGDESTLLKTLEALESQPRVSLRSLEVGPSAGASKDPFRARFVFEGYYLTAREVGGP